MPALKNARHEAFAQAYAIDRNASKAFRTAGGKGNKPNVQGSKLVSRPEIKARVEELRAKADAKSEEKTVLTILEKRQFLARVLRTPLGEITRDSDLCQEWSLTEGEKTTSERLKMPSKLEAIKIDNDLAVEGAEAGANKALEIIIRKL